VTANAQTLLDQINDLKALTVGFASILKQLAATITDDLSLLPGLIPAPPGLSLSDIVGLATCPLTPLALALDPSIADPRLIVLAVRRFLKAEVAQVIASYEIALSSLASYDVVKLVRKYVQECMRVVGDPADFAANFGTAAAVSATVLALCPETYNNPAYPFQALVQALSGFTYDPTTFLPSGIEPSALPNVTQVALAEVKLTAWRQACVLVV
jgi:hypothetical protein